MSLIYNVTKAFPQEEIYEITAQIRRSAISVASNIAEGSSRISVKEQKRYYEIAFSNATECLNQLIISNDLGYIENHALLTFRENISRITYSLNKLKSSLDSKLTVSEPSEEYKPKSTSLNPINPISPINLAKENPELIQTIGYTFHYTALIDNDSEIGEGTKIWHFSHIMPHCKIGKNCNIGQNVVVSPEVILGNNVKVQNNVSIYTGVTCDDDVFLGPSCVFTNVVNPRSAVNRRGQYSKTHVGQGASIGANATIVCGHDIGKFAFIGAGAVVTKHIPDYALAVGNPAKQMGWMSEYGHRLKFDDKGEATCIKSGDAYILKDKNVHKVGE
ncbi:hypothetical protein GCM10007940_34570 [Portibacter lacus]|uniref:UDP-2-acetamido-3-amino-2, 3-dideoxy-D-glucuronate N-acetyltransferase n=1 Tax=Portibacter lacus TaxID=1099794 RepID=A0AA37SQ37_9BACT|nr:hypothetical protein GCM10007940_34570 [Portibacter lacus]